MESTEDSDGECEINEGGTVVVDEDNLCVVDNSKATKNQSEGNERKRKRAEIQKSGKKIFGRRIGLKESYIQILEE